MPSATPSGVRFPRRSHPCPFSPRRASRTSPDWLLLCERCSAQGAAGSFTAWLLFIRVGCHIVLLLGQEKNVSTTYVMFSHRCRGPTPTRSERSQTVSRSFTTTSNLQLCPCLQYKHAVCLAMLLIKQTGLENTLLVLSGQGIVAFGISFSAFPRTLA